jgi:hypothetical protein
VATRRGATGGNEPAVGAGLGLRHAAPTYFNWRKSLDLRRVQRDPAQHHRQGDSWGSERIMDFDLIAKTSAC